MVKWDSLFRFDVPSKCLHQLVRYLLNGEAVRKYYDVEYYRKELKMFLKIVHIYYHYLI